MIRSHMYSIVNLEFQLTVGTLLSDFNTGQPHSVAPIDYRKPFLSFTILCKGDNFLLHSAGNIENKSVTLDVISWYLLKCNVTSLCCDANSQ